MQRRFIETDAVQNRSDDGEMRRPATMAGTRQSEMLRRKGEARFDRGRRLEWFHGRSVEEGSVRIARSEQFGAGRVDGEYRHVVGRFGESGADGQEPQDG